MDLTVRDSPARHARRWPPALVAALLSGALVAVFLVDRANGAAPFQHLYYLPIILAAVRFGIGGGTIAALAAIVLYHLANPHLFTLAYEEADLVQITLFLATGAVAGRVSADAERLRRLAMTDDLTGLHNLRSFEGGLATMVREARDTGAPVALLVLDLDRLKALNDQHGHLAGAEAVRTVGQLIGETSPSHAVACRYGGDEFAVALPRCNAAQAWQIADALRCAVHQCAPVLTAGHFPAGTLSISVGVASVTFAPPVTGTPSPTEAALGESLFQAADAALYRAKARGRNLVAEAQA